MLNDLDFLFLFQRSPMSRLCEMMSGLVSFLLSHLLCILFEPLFSCQSCFTTLLTCAFLALWNPEHRRSMIPLIYTSPRLVVTPYFLLPTIVCTKSTRIGRAGETSGLHNHKASRRLLALSFIFPSLLLLVTQSSSIYFHL